MSIPQQKFYNTLMLHAPILSKIYKETIADPHWLSNVFVHKVVNPATYFVNRLLAILRVLKDTFRKLVSEAIYWHLFMHAFTISLRLFNRLGWQT